MISTISPTTGEVGTQVTVSGTGFGATQGSGSLTLGTVNGTIVSWTDTQIVADVVAASASGIAQVQQNGLLSNSVTFTVLVLAPAIITINPNSGAPGTMATIQGQNFGTSQGSSQVTVAGTPVTPANWSDTLIGVYIPSGPQAGQVPVAIVTAGGTSNAMQFTVAPAPVLTSISPNTGGVGMQVTITGSNFGAPQGNGSILVGGRSASVISWGDTQIMIAIPGGISSTVPVTVFANGTTSNAVLFTLSGGPQIANITSGLTGQVVSITGSGFDVQASDSSVMFGSVAGQPVAWSDTDIDVPVPSGFSGGFVVVSAHGSLSNSYYFAMPLRCKSYCFAQATSAYLMPSQATILVGDTAEFSIVDQFTDPLTPVTWTISDSSLATTQADGDNVIITATAPGTLTVTGSAGGLTATAQVTIVSDVALADGTQRWSVPIISTSLKWINSFTNAQPASGSNTNVLAADNKNVLRGFSINGQQICSHAADPQSDFSDYPIVSTPSGGWVYVAGLVIVAIDSNCKPLWSHSTNGVNAPGVTVGQDGTVFAVTYSGRAGGYVPQGTLTAQMISMDGTSGALKWSVPLPLSAVSPGWLWDSSLPHDVTAVTAVETSPIVVLGDGSAYVTLTTTETQHDFIYPNPWPPKSPSPCPPPLECWNESPTLDRLSEQSQTQLLRISPSGAPTFTSLSSYANANSQIGAHQFFQVSGVDVNGNPTYSMISSTGWNDFTVSGDSLGAVGEITPDGAGGLLIAFNGDISANTSVRIMHFPSGSSPGNHTDYTLPLTHIKRMVIGENGTAFAAGFAADYYTPRLVSFDLNSGSPKWTYDSSYGQIWNRSIDLVAAAPNGGLWASQGWVYDALNYPTSYSPEQALLLDNTGQPISASVAPPSVEELSSAGIGMDTWYASPYSTSISAYFSSTAIDGANSVYAAPDPSHVEKHKISVQVFQLDPNGTATSGSNTIHPVLPITIDIAQRVNQAIDFWQKKGILMDWNRSLGNNGIQTAPLCTVPPCLASDYDYFANPPGGKTDTYMRAQYFLSYFSDPKSVYYIFVNSVGGSESQAGTVSVPDLSKPIGNFTGFSNIVVAGRSIDDVLPHETGHVFNLFHRFKPWNLMCGDLHIDDGLLDLALTLRCNSWWSGSIDSWQVTDAKKGAAKYEQ